MNEPASTWAEFVEAALLQSYRREHDVPLKELRDFIERLREEFQVPYPLADRRPYVGSGRLPLVDLQDRSHLDPEFCLVAVANGQIVLTAPGEEFYERVDWSGDEPAAGLASARRLCFTGPGQPAGAFRDARDRRYLDRGHRWRARRPRIP